MSLRVISGSARGMKLKPVPGDSTRPIMDRVKESLFNIISDDVIDSVFLDLFAGTGSVGIEALSRGATHCTFIELDRKALKTIRGNLTHTRLAGRATVIQRNAYDIVERDPDRLYHFVYIAPPQYKTMWVDVLQRLDANTSWHQADTVVIVQIDPKEYDSNIQLENLQEYDQRKYGSTLLVFYEFILDNDETNSQEADA